MIEKLSFLGMNSFGILFSKLLLSETEFFKVYGSVMTVMKFQVVTVGNRFLSKRVFSQEYLISLKPVLLRDVKNWANI